MTVHDITKQYLIDNKYDGLYRDSLDEDVCEDACACVLVDLFPCIYENVENCIPGYKIACDTGCCKGWHISPNKPEVTNG